MFIHKFSSQSLRFVLMAIASCVLSLNAMWAQDVKVTGKVTDKAGEPLVGVYVLVQGTTNGSSTDIDGNYAINAPSDAKLLFTSMGFTDLIEPVNNRSVINVVLFEDAVQLGDVVVTAMGIKKERKSLGYAVTDLKSEELMKNKSANAITSLSGKIAGVNITQSSGAAGSGAQIILRGGTSGSENKDNQPLFVVDGIIYDNSSNLVGNSAFDGSYKSASTTSNRIMDINPEDIENMSILKGPAASALYGSRAANGVVLITTKKGKEGSVEVNFNSKLTTSWVTNLPAVQKEFNRGFMQENYAPDKSYLSTTYNDFSYNSWGDKTSNKTYDNIGDFFQGGLVVDESLSISGGTKNSNYYLSSSYYDQDGVVPNTGYKKYSFRFNGEQKAGIFTFNASAAYSDAHTDRTLTGAGLYGSSGTGALYAVYNWSPFDDMKHYLDESGSRYRMFQDRLDPWDERDNPYWIVNKNKIFDNTERFTGSVSARADIAKWWFVQYKLGVDSYTQVNSNRIASNGAIKQVWQKGMMSDNNLKFRYLSHNFISNMTKKYGDFDFNLLLGAAIDDTQTQSNYKMGWNFTIPEYFSYDNTTAENKQFSYKSTSKRLVGVFGEFRASWKNMLFLTVTGRNDWTSTLPIENRSYFYPSLSASFLFSELLPKNSIISYGKFRASYAKVGKDTSPYETATSLWPTGTYLLGKVGVGNYWQKGNAYLKPENTKSIELGLEMNFFNDKLRFDYAFYTNDSYDQILSPRGPQSTGYIFFSMNSGNVYNRGMELSISGTPVEKQDLRWDVGFNIAGNRGTLDNLPQGMDVMYVTDVQYAGAQAASFNGGKFMAIAGTEWKKDENGNLILDKNGMPTYTTNLSEVGNREASFSGGLNNTLTWKNFSFNMAWEFRVGGDVINGTQYAMDISGVSKFSGDVRNKTLTISGVDANGNAVTNSWDADKTYMFDGIEKSGYNIIKDYYTSYYVKNTRNYITDVNLLRLRTLNVTYDFPKTLLKRIGFIKRASVMVSANNLLLFTNYDGDPEVAASGAGVGGSSSVGFAYCGVPSTSGMTFGLNLTF